MLSKILTLSVLAAPALLAAPSYAQPPADTLDLTMVLLPEHATGPQDITRRIELPPARGRDNAENRGKSEDHSGPPEGKGEDRETADQARDRGREAGQQVSEEQRENREQAGHGKPPEPPGRPESPGNSNPPGQLPGNGNPGNGNPNPPGQNRP